MELIEGEGDLLLKEVGDTLDEPETDLDVVGFVVLDSVADTVVECDTEPDPEADPLVESDTVPVVLRLAAMEGFVVCEPETDCEPCAVCVVEIECIGVPVYGMVPLVE